MTREFIVNEDHIKLLKAAYTSWDDAEFGAPSIDPKRPYGDSMAVHSMAEVLGHQIPSEDDAYYEWEGKEYKKYCKLHEEMETVLQILLRHADTGLQPGIYSAPNDWSSDWKRKV